MKHIKFFTENEICNPSIDSNPAKKWEDMPLDIRKNLSSVLYIADEIQGFLNQKYAPSTPKMTLTSTWRPHGRTNSAHHKGKAVDFQIFNRDNDRIYLNIMDFLVNDPFENTRAILEWRGNNPWIHLDCFFKKTKVLYMTAYPPNYPHDKKMHYIQYERKLPQKYIKV